MIWLHWSLVGFFAILGAGCILLVVMQLPGTWLMVGLGALVQLADVAWVHGEAATAGWWALGIAVALAIVGEVLESASSAAGAKIGGGTRRAMWGGFIGGILGAIIGTFVIPIPLLGTFVGAIAGAFIGAFVGEVTGSSPRSAVSAVAPATGAAAGRAMGTLLKVGIATATWVVLLAGFVIR